MTTHPYGFIVAARPWRVTTQVGTRRTTHEVMAATAAQSIVSALELAGPGARLIGCVRGGEW